MDTPVRVLVERAAELERAYGWVSAGVLQRRLRVSRRMADYLVRELSERAG